MILRFHSSATATEMAAAEVVLMSSQEESNKSFESSWSGLKIIQARTLQTQINQQLL